MKMDYEYLIGYVDGDEDHERMAIAANAENIASFLVTNAEKRDITITTPLDTVFITARYGFIDKCTDQEYLIHKLLPVLIPMQREETEPKPIEVYDETMGFYDDAGNELEDEDEFEI